jgi:acetyltransferase
VNEFRKILFPVDFSKVSNPMILANDQGRAEDARVAIKSSQVPYQFHSVISPYPSQYEKTTTTKRGLKVFIRPIKPEDAPLLVELFHNLSRQSVYYRFFSPLKSLSSDMLARFTQIDYDRDMALVAMDKTQSKEKILGVARFMGTPDKRKAEFAVAVGDRWHGTGIGAALMERLVFIARERGVEYMWGDVLAENRQMLALARKLGFAVSFRRGEGQYELKLDLKNNVD